jgi:hypothetical protein
MCAAPTLPLDGRTVFFVSESIVSLHPLTFVAESDGVMIGRPGTDSYAVFPEDGAALLLRLSNGTTPTSAASWYEETYGETVDMADFLDTLAELGFVRGTGDEPETAPAQVRFQRLGRLLFSRPLWLCYIALCAAAVVAVSENGALLPTSGKIFFTRSLVAVELCIIVGQLPFMLLHEGFHTLAGRRLGIPTQLGIGRRMYYLVFETTLSGLLGVPKRKRYLPFLAGMVCDCLVLSALILTAAAGRALPGVPPIVGRFALALAFSTVLRLVWQFYVFLRTDLYYVFATALGCVNLHDATRAHLLNRIYRLLRKPGRIIDEEQWSERDRAVARWYAPFFAAGVTALIATGPLAVVPVVVRVVSLVGNRLADPWRSPASFWDTVVFLLLGVLQFCMAFPVLYRDRRRARAARSAATAAVAAGETLLEQESLR